MLLLNFKADPNIPNFQKLTPFDLAKQINFDLKRLVDLYREDFFEEGFAC